MAVRYSLKLQSNLIKFCKHIYMLINWYKRFNLILANVPCGKDINVRKQPQHKNKKLLSITSLQIIMQYQSNL